MYCRCCHYDLRGLSTRKCPECGTDFIPGNRKTYLVTLERTWNCGLPWFCVCCVGFAMLLIGPAFLMLGFVSFFHTMTRMKLNGHSVTTFGQKIIWTTFSILLSYLGLKFYFRIWRQRSRK